MFIQKSTAVFYGTFLLINFCVTITYGQKQALGSSACFQKRVNELIAFYTWPTAQLPAIAVRMLSPLESKIRSVEAATIILPLYDEQPILLVNHEEMATYTATVKDFVLAHEIAHYHQLCTNYTPVIWIKKYNLMCKAKTTLHSSAMQRLPVYELPHRWLSISVLKLYLTRCVELDADKRAVCALKTCIGGNRFFDHWITHQPVKTSSRILAVLQTCFTTHPTDYERKRSLAMIEKLKI
ncbi:M48 family metalloprotease [Candidatus Dependentiae bacterium]|nr:M48 family metalloprotease [Candidatus Dependentiae bacterium]